ncbi:MAG: hypothetical protein ACKPKO_15525, partial [Candidatus Fonsibacter sp.]
WKFNSWVANRRLEELQADLFFWLPQWHLSSCVLMVGGMLSRSPGQVPSSVEDPVTLGCTFHLNSCVRGQSPLQSLYGRLNRQVQPNNAFTHGNYFASFMSCVHDQLPACCHSDEHGRIQTKLRLKVDQPIP